jgi:primosomal protein N' (replication factor Y)
MAHQDDEIFRAEELLYRTSLGFPPAVRLIALHVSGALEPTVEQAAQAWATALSEAAKNMSEAKPFTILGPVRPPVARVRGRYRRQILIKFLPHINAVQAIRSTLADLESLYARRTVKFDVDVDPLDMW